MRAEETCEKQNSFFSQLLFLGLLIVTGVIIFLKLSSLLGAFLGASTLYILLRKPMFYLVEKRNWKRWLASLTLVSVVSLFFLGAMFGIFELIASEIQNLDPQKLLEKGNTIVANINSSLNINLLSEKILDKISPELSKGAGLLVNATYSFAIGIVFMILMLYFMLVSGRRMESLVKRYLPFRGESRKMLVENTTGIIYNNAIVIPITMLAQGLVAALIYWLFGLSDVILLAFLTAICGLIPMVGTIIVSVPLGLNLIFHNEVWQGITLITCGILIIANVDNLFRIIFNQHSTHTHPLIVILGVLIGIPMFGFWGIIFGPLLISVFLLLVKLYYVEYGLFSPEDTNVETAKEVDVESIEPT